MATKRKGGRSARNAMASAQQVNRERRTTDFRAPNRSESRAIAANARQGLRPQYAKGTSKAYQNAHMRELQRQREKGGRINVQAAHRKGLERHTQVYAGKASSNAARAGEANANRRSGPRDRRRA